MDSILPDIATGVSFVTGLKGIGKTRFLIEAEIPSKTILIDFDDGKGRQFYNRLGKFGLLYYDVIGDLTKQHGPKYTGEQVYFYLEKLFKSIETEKYNHIILDNIDWFEKALLAEVKRDPKFYGIDPSKAVSGAYGGAWPGVNELVSGYISYFHSKKIQLVSAIAHTKGVWAGGAPVPNKVKPRGVDKWQQMSILSLALISGRYSPVPSALVLKVADGVSEFDPDTGRYKNISRRLPLRLPKCTWDDIKYYLDNPADLNNPKDGEKPEDDEIYLFSEKFSNAQMAMVLAEQKKAELEEAQELAAIKALQSIAPNLDTNDKGAVKNALEQAKLEAIKLKEELGPKGAAEKLGITIPELMKRIAK